MKIIIFVIILVMLILGLSLVYQMILAKHTGDHCGENSVCIGIPMGVNTHSDMPLDFGNNMSDKCIGIQILKHKSYCTGG